MKVDQPYTITLVDATQFIITGHTYNGGQADLWLIKVNDKGEVINSEQK